MDWLTNIKGFIDVVDFQSFTKAAEKRYSSPAAMSRRVSWLEDHLGVKLIERTTRTLQLTEEGKYFYQKGKQLLANLHEFTNELQTQKKVLKGPLKITMPHAFGELRLVSELIKNFMLEHSEIDLTLDFSNQARDLVAEEIDVAFRTIPYQGTGYQSEKIAEFVMGVYAAPLYLKQNGIPKNITDLIEHNCLLHHHIGYAEWEFKNGQKQIVAGNIKANSSQVLIAFAKSGLGLVRTLEHYVQQALADKLLKPVLKDQWPESTPLYLVYRASAATPLRIKTFINYLHEKKMGQYLAV